MYSIANLLLVASLFITIACSGVLLLGLLQNNSNKLALVERGNIIVTGLITLSVCILLYGFIYNDFTVKYVAENSSLSLPLFYRITAIWAGQSGSLLFWAWTVVLSGAIFVYLPAYTKLTSETKAWYWVFYFCIIAFFLLLITAWSNPFATLKFPPQDGLGLNPLLQNPGMIFHPPLLFMGYGGFVVPGCLALAQTLAGNLAPNAQHKRIEPSWAEASRGLILISWSLLTAGIILGAWWAYMELGWGGYWAWDPVENASLIPWLIASAYLHTAVIESRRNKLRKINVFLMALTTISAFFATYLVRSGVIQSLHAFPDGTVGKPLLIFILAFFILAVLIPLFSKEKSPILEGIFNKEGLLSFVAWILLALSFIILIATLWPVILTGAASFKGVLPEVIAAKIPSQPMGLEAAFYNKTCLPLFGFLAVLLMFGPIAHWKNNWVQNSLFLVVITVTIVFLFTLWSMGIVEPVALVVAACGFGALAGIVALFVHKPSLLDIYRTVGAHGVHIGLLMIIIGVAFSGPYQTQHSLSLSKANPTATVSSFVPAKGTIQNIFGSFLPLAGSYTINLQAVTEGQSVATFNNVPHYQFIKAKLAVFKGNSFVGLLEPQMRVYSSNSEMPYREVATIFGMGNELYATLNEVDPSGKINVSVNVNPLVNWLWIGGTIMCLFPFVALYRKRKKNITVI